MFGEVVEDPERQPGEPRRPRGLSWEARLDLMQERADRNRLRSNAREPARWEAVARTSAVGDRDDRSVGETLSAVVTPAQDGLVASRQAPESRSSQG